MRLALRLAKRGYGHTSPNPMVGAVLVKNGQVIGQGWHHRAGQPHAEIEALRDAAAQGHKACNASLYVTLEPCCTYGRTPPCTQAIIEAGIKEIVAAAQDPNPVHAGRGFEMLRKAGIKVQHGLLKEEALELNAAFNHWITCRTPLVTLKAAMTLDGKIATSTGESQWITGDQARAYGMRLRRGSDALLVGVNTIIYDDPGLTFRPLRRPRRELRPASNKTSAQPIRRVILDSRGRIPVDAGVVRDEFAQWTTIVVTRAAALQRIEKLKRSVHVWRAPAHKGKVDLRWLLEKLGSENVTSLLVEGGGEVHASFLQQHLAHRIAFFYAPKIIGGATAHKTASGEGARSLKEVVSLRDARWHRLGMDLLLTASID